MPSTRSPGTAAAPWRRSMVGSWVLSLMGPGLGPPTLTPPATRRQHEPEEQAQHGQAPREARSADLAAAAATPAARLGLGRPVVVAARARRARRAARAATRAAAARP